jgi:hypothetical protein
MSSQLWQPLCEIQGDGIPRWIEQLDLRQHS